MAKTLYPPRPSSNIQSHELPTYEKTGEWLVQRKFNGTRTVINISKDRKLTFLTRHGESHKRFVPSEDLKNQILGLNLESGQEYWLDSELLDSKTVTKQYKNKIVLFDVLQAGRYLFGRPDQMARLDILKQICGNPTELEPNLGIALKVSDNVWMAEDFHSDFEQRFQDFLVYPEIEGVVLRKKKQALDNFGQKEYLVSWLIRCRKPTKNYFF